MQEGPIEGRQKSQAPSLKSASIPRAGSQASKNPLVAKQAPQRITAEAQNISQSMDDIYITPVAEYIKPERNINSLDLKLLPR